MSIQFFNTYSRQVEPFAPLDPEGRLVRMYTCGPTVYNHAHIGNFRAYVFEDLLQRHLEVRGFSVERVMNLTDVDDKTIRGCRAMGQRLADFTAKFKEAFFVDCAALRIARASHYPAATEPQYIARMIEMIRQLEGKGIAYQAEDKSVYFRLGQFPDYGKLAHLNLEELPADGAHQQRRIRKGERRRFCALESVDEADGDVFWESPWGRGRPGWHIECSAMATALLGPQIDIHCGGVDNIFPHHEAEIAQSECCTGLKFVRYWLHCAHLMVEGQKMSKSLGNFYTLRDLLEKGYTGREVRFELLRVNYRLPLNFTFEGLEGARASLARLDEWTVRLADFAGQTAPQPTPLSAHGEEFFKLLDDELNISGALGAVFNLVRESNKALDEKSLTPGQASQILAVWNRINQVLALERDAEAIPEEVQTLVHERQNVRAAKDWKRSDELRDRIAAHGWIVKDTKEGPKLTPR